MSNPLDPLGRTSALLPHGSLLALPLTVLPLLQEKERNAKRKKKKGAAVQNEEAAFPPAAEDEEMEVSGTSGNEEEMAEEAEGEAGEGCGRERAQLCWLCCPVANVSTHKGSVTPKSHPGDGVSQHSWHFGCLWISGLQGVPWITALLPCLSGQMAILGALWFLISVTALSKSAQLPRASCKSHFLVVGFKGGSLNALSHHCGAQGEITHQDLCVPIPIPSGHCRFPGQRSSQSPALEQRQGKPWSPTSKADAP